MTQDKPAIVGIGTRLSTSTASVAANLETSLEAIGEALDDAGLSAKDITLCSRSTRLEGVRQIRGTSTCQVSDASVALVAAAAVVPTGAILF